MTFTGTGTSTPSFIPALSPLASALGIGSQPAVLNLAGGAGPTMTGCLESAVRGILGADATYIGQVSSGAARISQGGKIISFYPINASASLTPIGANLGGTNLLNVGTSCGNFDVAPALYNVAEFGAAVNALGVAANINPHGVITVVAGSTVYVARPEYFATPGTPGAPSLRQGPDGLYRFTDSAGFSQLLRPAFEDTTALASQAPQALATGGGSTTMVQVDGTALLTSVTGATQFLLTPDLTRSTAADAGMALWRQDAPNHFLFRGSAVSAAQGFGSSKTR
nr:hypothetical protein [uncultured Rhodoferax sp.]